MSLSLFEDIYESTILYSVYTCKYIHFVDGGRIAFRIPDVELLLNCLIALLLIDTDEPVKLATDDAGRPGTLSVL